jgi:hypothetical protein
LSLSSEPGVYPVAWFVDVSDIVVVVYVVSDVVLIKEFSSFLVFCFTKGIKTRITNIDTNKKISGGKSFFT